MIVQKKLIRVGKKKIVNEWNSDTEATFTKESYDELIKEGKIDLFDLPSDPMSNYKFIDGNRLRINYEYPEDVWKNKEHPRWSEYIYAKLLNVKKDKDSKPVKIISASFEMIEPPKKVSIKTKYKSFEDFIDNYHGYEYNNDKIGYWSNEKGKWDWHLLGGRWTGMLKLKEGATGVCGKPGTQTNNAHTGYVDSARKCDIDFIGMVEKGLKESTESYEEFLLKYENDKECKKFNPFDFGVSGEKINNIFIPETKESYIKKHSNFVTFSVLKDGEWFERGSMGWWGISSNNKPNEVWDEEFNKLIDNLPEDTLLSVYDCHI